MVKLKFIIHDNINEAIAQKLAAASTKAEQIVTEQVKKDTSPYVPARNFSLDQRTQVVGNMIIYPGPYARFLYYGKLMIDPNTGSAWAPKGASKEVTGKDLNISTAKHEKAQAYWFEAAKAQNMGKWLRVANEAIKHEL